MCTHIIGDIIRWLRRHKQGGRIAGHSFARGAERVTVWQACNCHEEVRMTHSRPAGFIQCCAILTLYLRSGRSIFSRPRAIDLSTARTSRLDIDLDDEESQIGGGIGNNVEFDAGTEFETPRPRQGVARGPVRVHQSEEEEADVWARLG